MQLFLTKLLNPLRDVALFTALSFSLGMIISGCDGLQTSQSVTNVSNVATNQDASHQALPAKDGWASADIGTTGGSAANTAHIFTVSTRAQLIQALGGNNKGTDTTPKVVYIKDTIYGNQNDAGKMLTCDDYATGGYTLKSYLAAYDPNVWGRTKVPSGALEAARDASEYKQGQFVKIYIPSNTTIIGAGNGARILGANFVVQNTTNVIIRNLSFENTSDCFPQWDPTDGANGNWNSSFDNLSLTNATHVWIDHNLFTDGPPASSAELNYFGRIYEQYDGSCDIIKGSDLVTISWNRFTNHSKTMLIGSSDSTDALDTGKLRVTVHHNEFENTLQRLPRVRFGQVHIYDNYYNEGKTAGLVYLIGVGKLSEIYAQNNYYDLPTNFNVGKIIGYYKGTKIHTEGDLVNGKSVDVLAIYNALQAQPALTGNVDWTPQYSLPIDPTQKVPDLVGRYAGPGPSFTSTF